MEDALSATRAAVEEGIVPGGGVAYIRAMSALDGVSLTGDEEVGRVILRGALEEPVRIIARNSGGEPAVVVDEVRRNSERNFGYDAAQGEYGDLVERGIIDPTKVSRSALENASSVAGMILTTYSRDNARGRGRTGPPRPPPLGLFAAGLHRTSGGKEI